jgi:hypothetical protein
MSTVASEYSIEDLQAIFCRLAAEKWRAIIVGGQAVNLWAMRFEDLRSSLRSYRPYTSRDLDFYGGRVEAKRLLAILGGRGKLNDGTDPSPNAAVIEVLIEGRAGLVINVLTGVYGVSSSELSRTAVQWTPRESGIDCELNVMHPLLLLESKLACLRGLSQHGRQDQKHCEMMLLVVNAWLANQTSQPRSIFKAVERIAALMQTPDGLHADGLGIDLWDSISLEQWKSDINYALFFEKRLPQIREEIEQIRASYRQSFS